MKQGDRTDDWDEVLLRESPVEPREDFVDRVMSAVRETALVPPPIEVPWRRVAAGLAALLVISTAGAAFVLSRPLPTFALEGADGGWERTVWFGVTLLTSLVTITAVLASVGRVSEDGVDGLSV